MKLFIRSGIGVCALVALAALVVMPDHATGKNDGYSVVVLENPDEHPYVYANDINDSGRIVGGQEFFVAGTGWFQEAVLWKTWDADPVVLKPLEGHTNSLAASINSSHVVCGWSYSRAPYEMKAVIWDKQGKVVDMHPDLGRTGSQLWAMNHYGDVAGITFMPTYARAFLTPVGEDPVLLALDTDVYMQSWPYGVNKDCVVVGFARVASHPSGYTPIHACYWDEDGTFTDLHDDIEDDLGVDVFSSRAWTISDKGEIGGVAVVELAPYTGTENDLRAFIWTEDGGFDWVDDDGATMSAVGGGEGKYMVGIVDGALQGWDWAAATATIWTRKRVEGAVTWDFEELPKPTDHTGIAVWGANSSGRVVGVSSDEAGYWYAVYLTK